MIPIDEDPKDWEGNEEVPPAPMRWDGFGENEAFSSDPPPEKLRKQWEREEYEEKAAVPCPSCKKRVPASSFKCLYCGAQVFHDSGLLGKILKWIRGR